MDWFQLFPLPHIIETGRKSSLDHVLLACNSAIGYANVCHTFWHPACVTYVEKYQIHNIFNGFSLTFFSVVASAKNSELVLQKNIHLHYHLSWLMWFNSYNQRNIQPRYHIINMHSSPLMSMVLALLTRCDGYYHMGSSLMLTHTARCHQWPLLLTWFNFNPSMDK